MSQSLIDKLRLLPTKSGKILLGELSKSGNQVLKQHKDVTADFICCAVSRWFNNTEVLLETAPDGKKRKLRISCVEVED